MPRAIVDGFYTAITVGLIPTIFITLVYIGNVFSSKRVENKNSKLCDFIAVIFALIFAFDDAQKR